MRGLMQDRPLDVSLLMRRVEQLFGHKRIITATANGEVSATWAEVAGRARRLAAALDLLDVPRQARVGTFGWNSQRHVELYLAVPAGGRVLRTGDVATIDRHAYVRIVDRTKDLVKSGGEWISSVALENEIMAHPDVAEAAVIGIADDRWGERPLACVVPVPGRGLDEEGLRAHLTGRVAAWWIPERVWIVPSIPKTATGKFAKVALRKQFAAHRRAGDRATGPGTE